MRSGESKKGKGDPVSHPSHYTFGTIEVLDALDDWDLGFARSSIIKYIVRADKKGKEVEDLLKARFLLEREILKLVE
jgi:hypothetical protein